MTAKSCGMLNFEDVALGWAVFNYYAGVQLLFIVKPTNN